MNLKKFAAGLAMAGAAGAVALGFGAGTAQAKPHDPFWVPGDPPGHNPFGPPGQVMQGNTALPIPGVTGVPPGHWGETWLPPNAWQLGIPGPLPVDWNPSLLQWGVWWADQFIPLV
jgi:hypothetical protein